MYRLCDKLASPSLEPIKRGALAAIERSLSTANCAQEVFSAAADRHPEIREVAIDYMSQHLKEIDQSTMQAVIGNGPVSGAVLLALLQPQLKPSSP